MKVLITGTTQGIGRAIAVKFLDEGHTVMGIDRQEGSIHHPAYTHYVCDIRDYEHLPAIDGVEILINNAGTQNEEDIDTNLKRTNLGDYTHKCLKMLLYPLSMLLLALSVCAINEAPHYYMLEHKKNSFIIYLFRDCCACCGCSCGIRQGESLRPVLRACRPGAGGSAGI